MWLKACPKCNGDLYIEYRVGDTSIVCLQCGHELTPIELETFKVSIPVPARMR